MVLAVYQPGQFFDGLFKRVVLDKNFVQQRIAHISFEPFMRAILAQLSPSCESIIISGIDTQEMLERVFACGIQCHAGRIVACSASCADNFAC
ncbi:FIG00509894: hypothetical protein [Citrobacter freundii]|uniref:EAL domain-containing protein n=1 Tax=Citrobacter freundii TaxID=546 RepID=A0A7G2ISZ4_CITFR|nr:FIG00509894: hypothetical protein [Citrobacter freundii]